MRKQFEFPWFIPPFYDVPEFDPNRAPRRRTPRRRRLSALVIAALVAAVCAITATVALAVTTAQIATAVNRVEANGGAKWVSIYSRSGTGSGYFSANVCSNTINTQSTTYYYPYAMVFNYPFNSYTTNSSGGAYVRMGSVTSNGTRC